MREEPFVDREDEQQFVNATDLHVEATYRLTEALVESENRMRRRIELLSEVVFETDENYVIVFLNQAWEKQLGLPTAGCIGSRLIDHVLSDDQDSFADLMSKCKEQSPSSRQQFRFRRANGEIAWIEISMARIPGGGIVGVFYDVTEQKNALDEIAKLSVVASSTDNMVIITNADGEIEWANQAFVNISEYGLEELLGRNPGQMLQGAGYGSRGHRARAGLCLQRSLGSRNSVELLQVRQDLLEFNEHYSDSQ